MELFGWTEEEFDTRLAGSAIRRIGHERWLRNIAVALGNAVRAGEADAACTLAGSSMDYITPANASIDLVASGCRDARFNGHFVGKLILNPQLRYASIRLSSMRSLDAGTAQISAIIRH